MATLQFGTTLRNNRADQIESTTGTAALLTIRSGAAPANCGTANSGTVLATINLPSDWMAAASGGAKSLLGTWQDTSADATGTAGHFRIHDTAGTTCHIQGDITSVATGTGAMLLDNTSIVATQPVNITSFTITEGNA